MFAERAAGDRSSHDPSHNHMGRQTALEKTLMPGKTEAGGEGETEEEVAGWHHRLNGQDSG